MAPLAGMPKYWTQASAQLPHGWELRGVVKGPRQAEPTIHGSTWTAWATGDGQRVEGHGDTAEEAMADLANQLRAIRPDPTADRRPLRRLPALRQGAYGDALVGWADVAEGRPGSVVNARRWRGYPDLARTEIFSRRRLHDPQSHRIAATSPGDLEVLRKATFFRRIASYPRQRSTSGN
jgi:hypothetical protein